MRRSASYSTFAQSNNDNSKIVRKIFAGIQDCTSYSCLVSINVDAAKLVSHVKCLVGSQYIVSFCPQSRQLSVEFSLEEGVVDVEYMDV